MRSRSGRRALLLFLALVSSVAAQYWSPQALESHVVVGDGIARSRGAPRAHSDGLSITRSTPVKSAFPDEDPPVDAQAIRFSPPRIDLGRLVTCTPNLLSVSIENRGRVSVRLDGADFTQDGFSMAKDVRGIRLEPGDRFNVQFVFLPGDVAPNGVDAHLRVFTTSGVFALPITSTEVALNSFGVSGIKASVPAGVRVEQSLPFVNPHDYTIRVTEIFALDSFVDLEMRDGDDWIGARWPQERDELDTVKEVAGEYDKDYDSRRRAGRGPWDMPPRTTSPLVKVSLKVQTPGLYITYVQVAAGTHRLMLIPVHITVLKPGIHLEPKELDLGRLTEQHEQEPREVFFTIYNSGPNPIDILELKVLESNLVVSAQLRGSTTIPPRSRVYDALAVQLRVDKERSGSDCFATLLLKTNASSSELAQRRLRLYGTVLRGHLTFRLNDTLVGVMLPVSRVFKEDDSEEDDVSSIKEDDETPLTRLVSTVDTVNGMVAGNSEIRKLRLFNNFDRAVELQRVWIPSGDSRNDESQEISVYKFSQSVAQAGSAWPKISLQIKPNVPRNGSFLTARSFPLMIETNATRHLVQMYLYHNVLILSCSSGMTKNTHVASGYYPSTDAENQTQNAVHECLPVPPGGLVSSTKPRVDGGKSTEETQSVQLCRSLLFDLGKVASHKTRTEMVDVINVNPVPITMEVIRVADTSIMDIEISASVQELVVRGVIANQSNVVNVSLGDTFVLQPGFEVIFCVKMLAKESLGNFTIPVLSLATVVEVMHLSADARIVQGTIEPVTPAIILPSMFPGRTEVIHLQYRNTFAHSVTPVTARLSSSKLKILSMSDAMGPQRVARVLDVLFSPAADAKCSNAMFLADCLLPLPQRSKETDQTCEELSDYGEFVSEQDLNAFRRRDAFWTMSQEANRDSKLEVQVHLQTDILDDVAGVTIMAKLERPLVTTTPKAPMRPTSNGSLNSFQSRDFPLTEVLGLSYIFVEVHNPSNISIQMELAIAEADRSQFYFCDQELNAKDSWGYMEGYEMSTKDTDINLALCLAEWKTAAANAVASQRLHGLDVDIPPFYFQRRIVRVLAGEKMQLGPIYYLPSRVQEVATTVFVRNDLSHIEPVYLTGHSGKGTLDLSLDTQSGVDERTPRLDFQRDAPSDGDNDGKLSFSVTHNEASSDFGQNADILLSNTGPFGLTINSVVLKTINQDMLLQQQKGVMSKEFSLVSKILESLDDKHNRQFNPVVLPSGETTHLRVSYSSNCYAVMATSVLVIDTSDTIRRIQLQGTIEPEVAFSCLRARSSPVLLYALHFGWMSVMVLAGVSILWSIISIPTSTHKRGESVLRNSDDSKTSTPINIEPHSIAAIASWLEEIERMSFTPSTRVVTPAVAALLEQRHKGLRLTGRTKTSPDSATSVSCEPEQPHRIDEGGIRARAQASTATDGDGGVDEECDGQQHLEDEEVDTKASAAQEDKQEILSSDDEPASELQSSVSSSASTITAGDIAEKTGPSFLLSLDDTLQLRPNFHGNRVKLASTASAAASVKPHEEPFDVFESLSARWRAQDWGEKANDTLAFGRLSADDDWDKSLPFPTIGSDVSASGVAQQRNEGSATIGNASRGPERLSDMRSSFLFDGLSAFDSTAPTTSAPPIAKKAPPGFSPADAQPLEARAAFNRLRSSKSASATTLGDVSSNRGDAFGGSSLFASPLPLFGPALPPAKDDVVLPRGVGRIGSGRSRLARTSDSSSSAQEGERTPSLTGSGGRLA